MDGVLVILLASSLIERGFEPRLSRTHKGLWNLYLLLLRKALNIKEYELRKVGSGSE